MVTSLLTVPYPGQDVVLETLLQCNGDVQAAAAFINSAKRAGDDSNPVGTKRKAPSSDLSDWLVSPHPTPSSSKSPSLKKRATEQIAGPLALAIKDTTRTPNSSPTKPAVDLVNVLRPSLPSKQSVPRLPPLTLFNPSMVAEHTPCTLHPSVLPPELACELFYTMMDLSQSWKRNKWWLFDRIVESPHRTSFFVRRTNGVDHNESWQEAAQYWYNGRPTGPPEFFPEVMENACKIVEKIVNDEMRKRERLAFEWTGHPGSDGQLWHANVAASNCYEGAQESVGFHSDQLTYLGPYPTIASLSLGEFIFLLRNRV
ncbi:hypothetical protein J3R82DRAFT_5430 [Butyriboletus roseoflavus]|nr:hypothetical protein J3R82DRAFT_5430 [Butyriboletus roseoflavus]